MVVIFMMPAPCPPIGTLHAGFCVTHYSE
jgi:hypothetical protein